jgi:PAS domain S-box-containing protein
MAVEKQGPCPTASLLPETGIAQEFLHGLLRYVPIMLAAQDAQLRYTSVQQPLLGLSAEAMLGRTDADLLEPPAAEQLTTLKRQSLTTGHVVRQELAILHAGGTHHLAVTILPGTQGQEQSTGLRYIALDITLWKQGEAEMGRLASVMVARERHWLGQELHDGLGQELIGLALMAGALRERLRGSMTPAEQLAEQILGGMDRVQGQVRALAQGLAAAPLDAVGLRDALAELAARTTAWHGVTCTFHAAAVSFPDAVAPHLLRIAQEAVSNALRHGEARRIELALQADADTLTLSVRDDGNGLRETAPAVHGLGLRGMRERAAALGGALHIGPAKGGGTLVTCTLPRRKEL